MNLSKVLQFVIAWLTVIAVFSSCAFLRKTESLPYDTSGFNKTELFLFRKTHMWLQEGMRINDDFRFHHQSKIDSINIDPENKQIQVFLNPEFGFVPFRETRWYEIENRLIQLYGKKFQHYHISVFAGRFLVPNLIPNYYRQQLPIDSLRYPHSVSEQRPLRSAVSKPYCIRQGLQGAHIALWGSHGWYYDATEDRWKWQRARVYQIVEDLLPTAFILQYLAPMLENAGANVLMPRERDLQKNEIIVDVPGEGEGEMQWIGDVDKPPVVSTGGHAIGERPYHNRENPFQMGTYWYFTATKAEESFVEWRAKFSQPGEYAVYVAYRSLPNSADDVRYVVHHAGGKSVFQVNQQIGGGTWIYLGTFRFPANKADSSAVVTLNSGSRSTGKVITADAVRFGGGMGVIARNGKTGGRPRFMEGSRYYLQLMGMPDTLVYNITEDWENDYVDDYRSRGEWVNYLRGAPFGPNKNRDTKGLAIPIDLSLAFHTDAGSTGDLSTIGTLMIVGISGADSTDYFPDGTSRLTGRDFADILQTQIVQDIRQKYDPQWRRRSIWDRPYSEAFRPNVPAALLELLSHHNFADMRFALDPRFRFDVCRSIYKAIVKYVAYQKSYTPVIQPLPVTHFVAALTENGVQLTWQAQTDSLEPASDARHFVVYTQVEDGGFDNGQLVSQPFLKLDSLTEGVLYRFKVTAVNEGGESFPSEILAVCRTAVNKQQVLVVNGFNRVAPPATIYRDGLHGFADFWDEGVPDKLDIATVGSQYDFSVFNPFQTNDLPGRGASHTNLETITIAGNTHDFVAIHGDAIRQTGFSFSSASDEAVESGQVALERFAVIDLILGEEKTTPAYPDSDKMVFQTFSSSMQKRIRRFVNSGGDLIVSGAYVASDLTKYNAADTAGLQFLNEVLKVRLLTNYAARTGKLTVIDTTHFHLPEKYAYNTAFSEQLYRVEAPDAIAPVDTTGKVLMRYDENERPAAVWTPGSGNVFIFGFPLEVIIEKTLREELFREILRICKMDTE